MRSLFSSRAPSQVKIHIIHNPHSSGGFLLQLQGLSDNQRNIVIGILDTHYKGERNFCGERHMEVSFGEIDLNLARKRIEDLLMTHFTSAEVNITNRGLAHIGTLEITLGDSSPNVLDPAGKVFDGHPGFAPEGASPLGGSFVETTKEANVEIQVEQVFQKLGFRPLFLNGVYQSSSAIIISLSGQSTELLGEIKTAIQDKMRGYRPQKIWARRSFEKRYGPAGNFGEICALKDLIDIKWENLKGIDGQTLEIIRAIPIYVFPTNYPISLIEEAHKKIKYKNLLS